MIRRKTRREASPPGSVLGIVPLLFLGCSKPMASDTDDVASVSATSSSGAASDTDDTASSNTIGSTSTGSSSMDSAGTTDFPPEDGSDPSCGDGAARFGVLCFVTVAVPGLIRPERIADFNRDTHQDILEQVGSRFKIVYGDGLGNFPDEVIFDVAEPWSKDVGETALVGEFDGMSGIDIATLGARNDLQGVILVLGNNGSGTQFTPSAVSLVDVNFQDTVQGAIIDIDLDATLDIMGVSSAAEQPALQPLLNDGAGAYTTLPPGLSHDSLGACLTMDLVSIPAVGAKGAGLAAYGASCNDDQQTEFRVQIIRGDGQGGVSFTPGPATGSAPRGLAAGDLDGDERTDLVAWNQGDESFSIFLGQDNGDFAPATTILAAEVCPGCPCTACQSTPEFVKLLATDIDGDGVADIVLTADKTWIGMNTFGKSEWIWMTEKPLLSGDFNEDGVSDLIVRNDKGTIDVLVSSP